MKDLDRAALKRRTSSDLEVYQPRTHRGNSSSFSGYSGSSNRSFSSQPYNTWESDTWRPQQELTTVHQPQMRTRDRSSLPAVDTLQFETGHPQHRACGTGYTEHRLKKIHKRSHTEDFTFSHQNPSAQPSGDITFDQRRPQGGTDMRATLSEPGFQPSQMYGLARSFPSHPQLLIQNRNLQLGNNPGYHMGSSQPGADVQPMSSGPLTGWPLISTQAGLSQPSLLSLLGQDVNMDSNPYPVSNASTHGHCEQSPMQVQKRTLTLESAPTSEPE